MPEKDFSAALRKTCATMAELFEGACSGTPVFRCPVFGDLAGAEVLGRGRLWTKHDFANLPDVPGDGPFRADFLAPVSSDDEKGPWVGIVIDRCENGIDVCAALGMEADDIPDVKILATFTESGFLDTESVGNELREAAASWCADARRELSGASACPAR